MIWQAAWRDARVSPCSQADDPVRESSQTSGHDPGGSNDRRGLLVRWGRASWQIIGVVVVAYLGLFAIGRLRLVLVPIIVALLVVTQLVPLDRWLRSRGLPDLLSAWITFLTLLVFAAVLLFMIVPSVASEAGKLSSTLTKSGEQIEEWLVSGPLGLSSSSVDDFVKSLSSQASNQEDRLLHGAIDRAPIVVESLAAMLLTVVLVFFLLKDGDRIVQRVARLGPEDRRLGIQHSASTVWRVLTAYVRGSATNGLVNAVVLSVALLILGIPLVLPIAVFTFFGAFLPVVGAFISGGLAAAVALVESGPIAALIIIGVTVLIHNLESYVVGPIVMRRAVHLHPVAVILSIAAGSLAFGLLGAFLAVPVAAVGMALLNLSGDTSSPPSPIITTGG
jgi:putative heme transporter